MHTKVIDEITKGVGLLIEFRRDLREYPIGDARLQVVHVAPTSAAPRSPVTRCVVRLVGRKDLVSLECDDFGNVPLDFGAIPAPSCASLWRSPSSAARLGC